MASSRDRSEAELSQRVNSIQLGGGAGLTRTQSNSSRKSQSIRRVLSKLRNKKRDSKSVLPSAAGALKRSPSSLFLQRNRSVSSSMQSDIFDVDIHPRAVTPNGLDPETLKPGSRGEKRGAGEGKESRGVAVAALKASPLANTRMGVESNGLKGDGEDSVVRGGSGLVSATKGGSGASTAAMASAGAASESTGVTALRDSPLHEVQEATADDASDASSLDIFYECDEDALTPQTSHTATDNHPSNISDSQLATDIAFTWRVMDLFLNSDMVQAESLATPSKGTVMYHSLAFSIIETIKSLFSFEPTEIEGAIQSCRESLGLVEKKRKNIGGFLGRTLSVDTLRHMTPAERHAELIHAECGLVKSVLSITLSGDFIGFIKEALNMKSAYSVYRALLRYVHDEQDAQRDVDFMSGVLLGNGMISLILSLLPSTIIGIMSIFSIKGDRAEALALLQRGSDIGGLRSPICDFVLLTFHLVISSFLPIGDVDLPLARSILDRNMTRYPNGIFFLYFNGRLNLITTHLDAAEECYNKAIEIVHSIAAPTSGPKQFQQLQHICNWDLTLLNLARGDFAAAATLCDTLTSESNWSKAIYTYAWTICEYDAARSAEKDLDLAVNGTGPSSEKNSYTATGGIPATNGASGTAINASVKGTTYSETTPNATHHPASQEVINENMRKIPHLVRKIAGKSIPLEKYVARRAKKYVLQGNYLCLGTLDLAYFINALPMSPAHLIESVHLPRVNAFLELHKTQEHITPDDLCLALFLKGVLMHIAAEQTQNWGAFDEMEAAFVQGLRVGHGVQLDHHLLYFTHYELARLYADKHTREYNEKSRRHLTLIIDHKIPELKHKKLKGKVTLQNMAILRASALRKNLK